MNYASRADHKAKNDFPSRRYLREFIKLETEISTKHFRCIKTILLMLLEFTGNFPSLSLHFKGAFECFPFLAGVKFLSSFPTLNFMNLNCVYLEKGV